MALWHPFKQKQVGKGQEREKKKIIVPFRSYTMCNTKYPKNRKKIQKTKQYHYGFISSRNRLEKAEREKKLKIIAPFRSFPFPHNA